MFNGQNISGTTQTVVAGQKIALSVPTPSGYSIQSRSWVFSNQSAITGSFVNGAGTPGTQPSASAGGSEAADPPLNQNALTFYWVNPSDNGETVTYTYNLTNGASASATATFNIGGPTASTFFTATPGTVNVWPASTANGGHATNPWLELGNALTVNGMTFSVTAEALNSIPGSGSHAGFQWIQLINTRTNQYLTSPPTLNRSLSPGLDNWYPYVAAQGIPNSTNDNPGIELTAHDTHNNPIPIGEGADKFSATMYLMWDPALPSDCTPAQTIQGTNPDPVSSASTCTGSIPVPLAKVTWGYSGCAINTLTTQTSTSTTWLLNCGVLQPTTPTVEPATEFPQWSTTDGNAQ
ncbi:hypothetical protein [Paracidobacterium acidisoli]|uniref:hypothetical protein n=1 Tax=Paracidobacterium acidisoli TaxID=2303751 RepID=UPI0011C1211D|nr:hypothetical protein [Paracidobacterium acidisoli]MBT9332949.1 hypothetical protein [Paracidobacterium acidisoli]